MSKEMDKNIEVVENTDTGVIVFDKPYNWEGKEYTSVDISNMENLKGIDLIESLDNGNGLSTSVNGEYNLKTIMSLVSKATGIPVELILNDFLSSFISSIANEKPIPIIGVINGEINIAPMITGVESMFKPIDAINIAHNKVAKSLLDKSKSS